MEYLEYYSSDVTTYLTFFLFFLKTWNPISGSGTQDADSDEEWPALGAAGAGDSDAMCDTEIVVDAEDEKAMEMFMNKNPPMRQDTT